MITSFTHRLLLLPGGLAISGTSDPLGEFVVVVVFDSAELVAGFSVLVLV